MLTHSVVGTRIPNILLTSMPTSSYRGENTDDATDSNMVMVFNPSLKPSARGKGDTSRSFHKIKETLT